jgi:dihydroorotate dehydrogenase electron transfer subunit
MNLTLPNESNCSPALFEGVVSENISLCREHFRLTLCCDPTLTPRIDEAAAGQFVHLAPSRSEFDETDGVIGTSASPVPLLRRAFSIAGRKASPDGGRQIDVIYRVVGTATRWMAGLHQGDAVSVMGPLGNVFPIHDDIPRAWLVGGGVGLPPMLWLAEALQDAGRETLAIIGARSADLLALTIDDRDSVPSDTRVASSAAVEFAECGATSILCTDDGSLGFHGFTPTAMTQHWKYADVAPEEVVVYTCGPELMMRSVAEFCLEHGIRCYVCMERAMACGAGTCQSCVVSVRDEHAVDAWRYALCCDDGPVFEASRVLWDDPSR